MPAPDNGVIFLDNSAPIRDIFYAFFISEACLGERPLGNPKVRDWQKSISLSICMFMIII